MTTHRRRRLSAALLALGMCAAGAACSDDGDSDERASLELRPVLAANPPPCPTKAPKNELVLPKTTEGKTGVP